MVRAEDLVDRHLDIVHLAQYDVAKRVFWNGNEKKVWQQGTGIGYLNIDQWQDEG